MEHVALSIPAPEVANPTKPSETATNGYASSGAKVVIGTVLSVCAERMGTYLKRLPRSKPARSLSNFAFPALGYYTWNDASFWTSWFFLGLFWALYKSSLLIRLSNPSGQLLIAARKCQAEMAKEQLKSDNHDLGFMIMPSFSWDDDLTGNREALNVVVNAPSPWLRVSVR